jgi:hypothetical protein
MLLCFRCNTVMAVEEMRIVMSGTALGFLLELSAKDDKLMLHIGSLLPLFLAWQMSVAAAIGYCIVPRDGKSAPQLSG